MKVLFYSHDGKLGDAVLHTSFVEQIKRSDSNNKIYCIAANGSEDFWTKDERVEKVWNWDKLNWISIFKLGIQIRKLQIDYIVMWNNPSSEKVKILNFLIKPVKNLFYFKASRQEHANVKEIKALEALGINDEKQLHSYSISLSQWPTYDFEHDAIYFNLFASYSTRNIKNSDAIDIINALSVLNKKIYVTYIDVNLEQIKELERLVSDLNVEFVYTQGDLGKLFWLCSSVSMIISPDTAIVHIASAFNTPCIGLFLKDPAYLQIQWCPISDKSKVIEFLDLNENEKKVAIDLILQCAKEMLGKK